jgi:hypothetical protein
MRGQLIGEDDSLDYACQEACAIRGQSDQQKKRKKKQGHDAVCEESFVCIEML